MHDTLCQAARTITSKQTVSQPLWLFNGDERSSSAKTDVTLCIVAQLVCKKLTRYYFYLQTIPYQIDVIDWNVFNERNDSLFEM